MIRTTVFITCILWNSSFAQTDELVDFNGDGSPEKVFCREYIEMNDCAICPNGAQRKSFISCSYISPTNDTSLFFRHCTDGFTHKGIVRYGDVNLDGLPDALYFERNDSIAQWVVLINFADSFRAIYTGVFPVALQCRFDNSLNFCRQANKDSTQLLARWDASVSNFTGVFARWTATSMLHLKQAPSRKSDDSAMAERGDLLIVKGGEAKVGWLQIWCGAVSGWARESDLMEHPPFKRFP